MCVCVCVWKELIYFLGVEVSTLNHPLSVGNGERLFTCEIFSSLNSECMCAAPNCSGVERLDFQMDISSIWNK